MPYSFVLHIVSLKEEFMGSKRFNGGNSGKFERVDRINDLPDEILAHILSFLPTKDVVATSILSRRFKFFWVQVPAIDVGEDVYFHGCAIKKRIQFQNFVYNVLLLNKAPNLRVCCLTVPSGIDSPHANAWIEAIAVREVQEMHLDVRCAVKLPVGVFEKLKTLKLTEIPDFDMASLHLPNLHVLNLDHVTNFNGVSLLHSLKSCCPVLQELVIRQCEIREVPEGNLHVYSSTLKKLEIQSMSFVYVAVIDAPGLEYLMLPNDCRAKLYTSDLSSLREADISIPVLCYGEPDSGRRRDNLKFINTLTNLSTLRLRRIKFQDIGERLYDQLPAFDNLTCLELDINESCRCIVPAILGHTPNLVTFIMRYTSSNDDYDGESKCSHETHVPSCLLHSIKSIKIRDFDDSEESTAMVKYLLMNARVLNEMKIKCWGKLSPIVEMELIREVFSFIRGSPTSKVSLSSSS